MDTLHTRNKGKMLNAMEKIYIYKETRINNQMNDKCTFKPNIIFDTLIRKDRDIAHITLHNNRFLRTYLIVSHKYYSHASTSKLLLYEKKS